MNPAETDLKSSTDKFAQSIASVRSQSGQSLDALSRESPTLVVFLRHGGCPFCRQALADAAALQEQLESTGVRIALVHMMEEQDAAELFKRFGLDDVPRFGDPDRALYRAFELQRGSLWRVAGPGVWWSGLKAAIFEGRGFGVPKGDVLQLGGAFLLADGAIVNAARCESSSQRPDYLNLARF